MTFSNQQFYLGVRTNEPPRTLCLLLSQMSLPRSSVTCCSVQWPLERQVTGAQCPQPVLFLPPRAVVAMEEVGSRWKVTSCTSLTLTRRSGRRSYALLCMLHRGEPGILYRAAQAARSDERRKGSQKAGVSNERQEEG